MDPTPWVPRSASHETTYAEDIEDVDELREAVRVLARSVAADVAADGRLVERVAVKVRFRPFLTRSRSVRVRPPTTGPGALEQAALDALAAFVLDRPVRLLGVRADFVEARTGACSPRDPAASVPAAAVRLRPPSAAVAAPAAAVARSRPRPRSRRGPSRRRTSCRRPRRRRCGPGRAAAPAPPR